MKFRVCKLEDGTLTTDPQDYPVQEYDFVGEFSSDCGCDFIMNMIRINSQEGHCDKHLSELEEQIRKEGI
jgi:hypothetical protein